MFFIGEGVLKFDVYVTRNVSTKMQLSDHYLRVHVDLVCR